MQNLKPPAGDHKALDPVSLMLGSSGVVLVVLVILVVAAALVWLIWFLKYAQLRRLRSQEQLFERAADKLSRPVDLATLAQRYPNAPGARIVLALARRQQAQPASGELLLAVAKKALTAEQQRATVLMPTLSSIMDAFLRIGLEKSASLPVVAPAIGEALIATAFGLVAAIPATVGYNYVDKRIGDLVEELTASAEVWVATFASDELEPAAMPLAHVRR